jgi:hypothetical protein
MNLVTVATGVVRVGDRVSAAARVAERQA